MNIEGNTNDGWQIWNNAILVLDFGVLGKLDEWLQWLVDRSSYIVSLITDTLDWALDMAKSFRRKCKT